MKCKKCGAEPEIYYSKESERWWVRCQHEEECKNKIQACSGETKEEAEERWEDENVRL